MNTLSTSGAASGCPFHHAGPSPQDRPATAVPQEVKSKTVIPEGGFRCPFEIAGRNKGTVLEVMLSEKQDERFGQCAEAYERFHGNPEIPGICFVPPQSVQDAASDLHTTKILMLMHQAEIFGSEIACRFKGFWFPEVRNREKDSLTQDEIMGIVFAHSLQESMASFGVSCSGEADLIAAWLYVFWIEGLKNGHSTPNICIKHPAENRIGIEISPGGVTLCPDDEDKCVGALRRMNTFSLVKTPFYPETFGRYSDRLEIWVTRVVDFVGIKKEQRLAIRRTADAPLLAAGFLPEADESKEFQTGGVWIPKLRPKAETPAPLSKA